jgi:dTDP-4-dehydrorhamnose reductase
MARWLVTGAAGLLGSDLVKVLQAANSDVTALSHADLDITDESQIRDVVPGHDVVANLAAWTDVDGAETAEDDAFLVNAVGPGLLARVCRDTGARLIQISTDYVFDGTATSPYAEDAAPSPVNAYGRTKRAGETAVLQGHPAGGYVVRTSWLYGTAGRSFVTTMVRLASERDHVDVVNDQTGQPTWSFDVATRLLEMLHAAAPPGIYHATNSGETTWFGLARAVFRELGHDPRRVRPVASSAFPRPAPRPAYSVLGHGRWPQAGLSPMRGWGAALAAAMPSLSAGRDGHPASR